MEKLKVKFRRIDNVVIMKVVQQDESTRGCRELFNHNGFKILSNENISMCLGGNLMIRGTDKRKDTHTAIEVFHNTSYAKSYIKKAKACIKAYNESLEEKEEVVEKKEGRWIPMYGDMYYFSKLGVLNGILCEKTVWKNDDSDRCKLITNNVFQTEEECKRAIEIDNKKMELSKIFNKEEWLDRNVGKFYISYNVCERKCRINSNISYNTNQTTFPLETKAREFFNFCGADDYEKYVLGVY